jgi:putative ABC transport system permease protein
VTRLIAGVLPLPGVTGADPVTYAAVVPLLAASAFMASYLPTRRATRVDPIVALHAD